MERATPARRAAGFKSWAYSQFIQKPPSKSSSQLAFIGGNHIDPDVAAELFILDGLVGRPGAAT
jgi:hypothetical protein